MIGLALGHEHRSYKGPYANIAPRVPSPERPKRAKHRVAGLILSVLGAFS